MSWININYFPHAKRHIVHHSVVDICRKDMLKRHNLAPKDEVEVDNLCIDPGGIVSMTSVPVSKEFDDCTVSIKPEHILSAGIIWVKHRILDQEMHDGGEIVKVYCSNFQIIVMPKELYLKIGLWLMLSKGNGLVARAEMAEALGNLITTQMESEGDA